MKWLKKQFNKLFFAVDENDEHESFEEIEDRDHHIEQNTVQRQQKKAFVFPPVTDFEQPKVKPTNSSEETTHIVNGKLTLPNHLRQDGGVSVVYDVEVSGIKELLENRKRKDSTRQEFTFNSTRKMNQVLSDKKSNGKVSSGQKFIDTEEKIEVKRKFVPTKVPSPVYGFKVPENNQSSIIHSGKTFEELQQTKISDQNSFADDTIEQVQLHSTPIHNSEYNNQLSEAVEEVQYVEPSLSQTSEGHDFETESQSFQIEECVEELVKENEIEEQLFQTELKLKEEVQTEQQLQTDTITFHQSTVHIENVNITQSNPSISEPDTVEMNPNLSDAQAESTDTLVENSVETLPKAEPVRAGSRLPFNVLMLKSDKEKLAAKKMSDQYIETASSTNSFVPGLDSKNEKVRTVPVQYIQLEESASTDLDDEFEMEIKEYPSSDVALRDDEQENGVQQMIIEATEQQECSEDIQDAEVVMFATLEDTEESTKEVEDVLDETIISEKTLSTDIDTEDILIEEETVEVEVVSSVYKNVVENEVPTHTKQEVAASVIEGNDLSEKLENDVETEEQEVVTETVDPEIKQVEQSSKIAEVTEMLNEPMPYQIPPLDILAPPEEKLEDTEWMEEQGEHLVEALSHFQVQAQVESIVQGPAVTQFEITVGHGTKVSKVRNLADDIQLALAARDIRIDAPIPGKRSIGIEIPNRVSRAVRLSEVTNSERFQKSDSPLEAALGLDLNGNPVTLDLRKMPHGLIAGATGSGKSVCINSILVSLLYKAAPHELKLMLIDPKMVELAPFNHIPHLVSPVITDVKAATESLKWAVDEMERRYQLFMHSGTRDITRYNNLCEENKMYAQKLPYLLIVIDELADLMMMSPADVELAISRLAQKARACGIHLILATQRPSVDVITGTLKSNIPTRIAFAVSSQIDSRTIIDQQGAERLLGRGDMLYLGNGMNAPQRIQGTFVTDDEIEEVVQFARSQGEPNYFFKSEELVQKSEIIEEQDELFEEVCRFVFSQGTASTSSIQRRYHIGYNRAARLIDMLESQGLVSEQKGSKPRDVYITEATLENMFS